MMDNNAIQRDEIIGDIINDLRNEKIHAMDELDKYKARVEVIDKLINNMLIYTKK